VTTTEREVEHKLRVHGLYRLPDLTTASAGRAPSVAEAVPHPMIVLTATYYDTETLRLARSGITLRRREGGSTEADAGWHLKLPAARDPASSAVSRDEIRLPLDAGPPGEPPRVLLDLVLACTRGAAVEAVATLRTERTPYELSAADGHPIAELTDDSVSVLDGPQVVARFRELEVELREGTPAEVDAIVAQLVESGAIAGGLTSKAARALGPLATAPPDLPKPGQVRPEDPAGAALHAHLARHVQAFVDQDLRVRRDLPDSVHQLRVAARRIRSGLQVFRSLVDAEWANALRAELGWIAAELGAVRDREVLEDRLLRDLGKLVVEGPVARSGHVSKAGVHHTDPRDLAAAASVVRRAFDDERAHARAGVDTAMTSERYVALLEALVDAAVRPRLGEAADAACGVALPPLVRKAWRRLERDVALLDPAGADDDWHEARIAAKRVRYATEALVPVFGAPAKSFSRTLELVTEQLGEHQDAVIAAETTRRLAAGRRVTGTTGFVLGLLHEHERAAVTQARATFLVEWPEVSRRRHRAWLRAKH